MLITPREFIVGMIWHIVIVLRVLPLSAQGIDYALLRNDAPPADLADPLTTQIMLNRLNDVTISQNEYTVQEATEYLLQYGALLRTQILDTFGRLVYEHYDNFGINELDSLYKVYRGTLERQYNIFDILPSILADPDTRPSKICSHINRLVNSCLKDSSEQCMKIQKHDEPHPETLTKPALNITNYIFHNAKIPQHYPNGFSLKVILDYLRNGIIVFTPGLFSGLLHNIRYDDFDDKVRGSEKELLIYLNDLERREEEKNKHLMTQKEIKNNYFRNVGSLLKYYLMTRASEFPQKVRRDATYLANHLIAEIDAVNDNIQSLGRVYENGSLHLEYLFDLVLPVDLIDKDVIEARDYLLKVLAASNVMDEYLKIEKYQQGSPDQLLLQIVGQLREIGFVADIATSLKSHASFWHRSRMIESLNDFLELFDSYQNLRRVPQYHILMTTIDEIKNNLWNSKNVSIEMLCEMPRPCIRRGLQTIMECDHVNEETKDLIDDFSDFVTPKGHLIQNECPKLETTVIPKTDRNRLITTLPQLEPSTTTSQLQSNLEDRPTSTPISNLEPIGNLVNENVDEVPGHDPTNNEGDKDHLLDDLGDSKEPKTSTQSTNDEEIDDSQVLSDEENSKSAPDDKNIDNLNVSNETEPIDNISEGTDESEDKSTSSPEEIPTTIKPTNSAETPNEITTVPGLDETDLNSENEESGNPSGESNVEESNHPKTPSQTSESTEIPSTVTESDDSCELCKEDDEDCSMQCSNNKSEQKPDCDNLNGDCPNESDCSKEMNDCLSSKVDDNCSEENCESKAKENCKNGTCTNENQGSESTTSFPCTGADCTENKSSTLDPSAECIGDYCPQSSKETDGSTVGVSNNPLEEETSDINTNININPFTPTIGSENKGTEISPTGQDKESSSVSNTSDVLCDNHDPHHRSKLRRLENIKKITALKANMLTRFEARRSLNQHKKRPINVRTTRRFISAKNTPIRPSDYRAEPHSGDKYKYNVIERLPYLKDEWRRGSD